MHQHELDTAGRLAALGDDVEFIPADEDPQPDAYVNGQRWEFKSPTSTKRNTIMRKIADSASGGQSGRVVLDLARTDVPLNDAIDLARESLRIYPGVKVVRLIGRDTASGQLDMMTGGEVGGEL